MLLLLTFLSTATAAPTKGVRLLGCVGVDASCVFTGLKLGYNRDYWGASLGLSLGFVSSVQLYLRSPKENLRPYAKAGFHVGFATVPGGGVGLDWHFTRSKKWILSPQVGASAFIAHVGSEKPELFPSASIDLIYAFGK